MRSSFVWKDVGPKERFLCQRVGNGHGFFAFKSGNAFKTTGEVSDIDDFNVMVLAFRLGFSVGNAITMDGQTL